MCDLFLSERSTVELRAVSGRLPAASGRFRPDGSGRLLVGPNNCTTCKNLTLADLAVLSIYQRQ